MGWCLHFWLFVFRWPSCQTGQRTGPRTKSQKCKKWTESTRITKYTYKPYWVYHNSMSQDPVMLKKFKKCCSHKSIDPHATQQVNGISRKASARSRYWMLLMRLSHCVGQSLSRVFPVSLLTSDATRLNCHDEPCTLRPHFLFIFSSIVALETPRQSVSLSLRVYDVRSFQLTAQPTFV